MCNLLRRLIYIKACNFFTKLFLLIFHALQGRQGTVKHIYRGVVFLYDENETENGGYFCCKSKICEKVKFSPDTCTEKVGLNFIDSPLFLIIFL